MLCRDMSEYSMSFSSRWRPYVGWLGPSILTATEGWPLLQMGICLWSRSMDWLWGGVLLAWPFWGEKMKVRILD